MPDLNHKFQAGRMNKDLDERLVPNGEYRDALNVQVATSDGSDVGTLQNILGNLDVSSASFIDPVTGNTMDEAVLETYGFYCVGSVVDEKNDKLYWLVSGVGVDFIAEYDYNTKKIHPIVVDTFQANVLPGDGGRVLNFDKGFLITGINIMEETIFWTDNNTEPKRVNVPQIRLGTVDFLTHTIFHVPNPDKTSLTPFVAAGDLEEDHVTVIRKGPNTAPKLEMKNTVVGDTNYNSVSGETSTTLLGPLTLFWDNVSGAYVDTPVLLEFETDADFSVGDFLDIESVDEVTGASKKRKITVEVMNVQSSLTGQLVFTVEIRSWDTNIDLDNENFNVTLQQDSALFKYRFPRFGCRYKYKDGEYSAFSPFSEVAFLPGDFDYLPKEGYNLAMVNTVRALGVCDFVDERYIPEDVVSIDILYKESNSPAIYSITTVDRAPLDPGSYDSWNAISSTNVRAVTPVNFNIQTYGYVDIKSEMIHSILPDNQLLRPWDNVPRKALAQEVIGNRIVYANYLQNYNLSSSRTQLPSALSGTILQKSKNIEVDLNLALKTRDIVANPSIAAEELDAGKAYTYESAKTIKSLRTYQLGVVYIDEFGRETPVFSSSKDSRHTAYATKDLAGKATKLATQIKSPTPDFAKNFKFLVKETSSEYYNLAMDRWYNADDGNIWITFPSADRNKVDLETFLILKKAHKENKAVTDLARYKILDISNEAPRFVKTRVTPIRNIQDGTLTNSSGAPILMSGGNDDVNFPFTGGRYVDIHEDAVAAVINTFESEVGSAYPFQFRMSSNEGASKWYDIQSFESRLSGTNTYWRILATEPFGDDMGVTTPFNVAISTAEPAYGNCKVEFIKREEKNLPEFEGRFFVKILKDSELQENLLGYSSFTGSYSVANSIKSQYINPFSEVGDYTSTGGNWYGFNKRLISLDSHGGQTNIFPPTATTGPNSQMEAHGYEYWNHAGQTENDDSASSGWFIDSIEAFRPFKYTNEFYKVTEPSWYEAVVDATWISIPPFTNDFNAANIGQHQTTNLSTVGTDHPGVTNNAWNVWTEFGLLPGMGGVGFNLGVAEDYPRKQLQLIGDCTNAMIDQSQGGAGAGWSGYLGISDVLTPHEGSLATPGPNTVLQSAGVNEGGKIIPARGIDQANNLIHLSRAGIGWFNPAAEDLDTLNNGVTDIKASFDDFLDPAAFNAVDYVNELEFSIAISTPGTVWKWKEDPGQVVYQTQADPPPLSGITQTEWNASKNDALDARIGTMLFNYTKIGDYTTTHLVYFDRDGIDTPRWVPSLASQGIQSYDVEINPNPNPLLPNPDFDLDRLMDLTWAEEGQFPVQSDPDSNGNGRWPMYTQSWDQAQNKRRRYTIHAKPLPNSLQGITGNEGLGNVAPHFYLPTNPTSNAPHFNAAGEVLTATTTPALPTSIAPGIRPDGVYSGREGVVTYPLTVDNNGTPTLTTFEKIPSLKMTDGTLNSEAPGSVTWQILEKYDLNSGSGDAGYFTSNPAVWETEPKEDLGLEIYHEVGQIYPTELNEKTLEQFFGPIHDDLSRNSKVTCLVGPGGGMISLQSSSTAPGSDDIRIVGAEMVNGEVSIALRDINGVLLEEFAGIATPPLGSRLIFTRADGSKTEVNVKSVSNIPFYEVFQDVHNYQVTLPWFNAYSFGNGVESNRVRDDYNQITIDKGPKVSTVLEEPYVEERRSSGFIWSGIFNSMSGVNNLNQFIQAEKITKDLNPIHGSIQKLYARNTDLVTLCEDKVFKILANKDALYNADGNTNLTASQNVLGQTIPFSGDHGISTNPESFAADAYRLYFSDRARGSILRLSQDGLTPISSYGMTDWFADNLSESNRIIGSFDDKKKEYNISLSYYNQKTFPVKIMGHLQQVISLPNTPPSGPPVPIAKLQVKHWIADRFEIGDDITGPGIPIGTTVTNKSNLGGGLWQIGMSHIPTDVSTLGNHVCEDVDCDSLYWESVVFVSPGDVADPITLSYSEINKGWPSFKSFHYEEALSLNNDYFTFKGGQLYQHHVNDIHNNFYGEQYDSSVEVLFNEGPGIVKSFQSLDYEGSQSKVTSDGGLNEQSNSAEYWDNYAKLGWYVDNMYTDLQELEPAEFKNKEGKWFSAVKGVATEWLDDGKAGNIDTREFSYQGIDEAGAITVIDGGYTSWDCVELLDGEIICGDCRGRQTHASVVPITNNYVAGDFFWVNPAININNHLFAVTESGVPHPDPHVVGCGGHNSPVVNSSIYPNSPTSFTGYEDLYGCDNVADPNCGSYHDMIAINVADVGDTFHVNQTTNTGQNGEIYHSYMLRYTCVNDIVQWFIDNVDATAFYLGMSWSQFNIAAGQGLSGVFMYSSIFGGMDAGPCSNTQQTNTHSCVEIQDLTGAYPDKSTCEADTKSPCGDPCPTPNVVTAHPTHANANSPDGGCTDGSINVEVYMAGNATSWTVRYVDANGNVTVDGTTYTHNGNSNVTTNLPQGVYTAIVRDDLDCEEVVEFVIDCLSSPCSNVSPHDFKADVLLNPAWDKNVNDCWRASSGVTFGSGEITISNNSLVAPALMWSVRVYSVVNGVSTMIFGSALLYPGASITIDGLEEGDYEYEIIDDQPCPYPPKPFTLHCVPVVPCVKPIIPHNGYSITDATSTDGCATNNADGTHEIVSITLDPAASTFTAQYYEISGPTWPATTAIPISPLQGPAPGNVSLATPLGYYNLEAGPTVTTPGKYYAVVIEDDQGCELVQTFTVGCSGVSTICGAGTDPAASHTPTDATSTDCATFNLGDGFHTIWSVTLQAAAGGWTAEYFYDPTGVNTPLTNPMNIVTYQPSATMVTPDGGDNLGSGSYAVKITDNLGCWRMFYFTIGCDDSGGGGGGGGNTGSCSGPFDPWVSGTFYPDSGNSVVYNGEYYYPDNAYWVNNNGNLSTPPDQPGSYFTPCVMPGYRTCDCSNPVTFNPALAPSYTGGNVVEYTDPFSNNTSCYIHNGNAYNGILYYPWMFASSAGGVPLNSDPINPWVPCGGA